MLNIAGRRISCVLGMLPFSIFESRQDLDHSSRTFYLGADPNETGWDRLYNMYSLDEYGNQSPEMNFVLQGASIGGITGFLLGGITKGRVAYIDFIEKNNATKFDNHFEAKKKLQDNVTVNFSKGAFRWGWRLGLFCGSYILITTTIATYRGKSSLMEYVAAGLVTGSCYKFSLGPRAMLVAGSMGGILGGVAGILSLGLLRLSGTTMEEIRYWQYNWKKNRDFHMNSALKKAREDTPMEKAHDMRLKDIKSELIPDVEDKPKT